MIPRPPGVLALGAITFRDRPFEEVLGAARSAGFAGIGLTVGQCLSALERGIVLGDLRERVTDAGLRIAELELVRLCEDGPERHANALVEDLAGLLRPDRVHVAAWRGSPERIADEFAATCERLEGVPVAFEFMAYNAVPTFAGVLDLVRATGSANAGVVLDVLHFFRSGATFDQLDAAALDAVAVIQLSDVVTRPGATALDEARHQRTYPGRGELDVVGFLRAVHAATGSAGLPPLPITVEPINDAYERLPLPLVADEAMLATAAVLRQAGVPLPR